MPPPDVLRRQTARAQTHALPFLPHTPRQLPDEIAKLGLLRTLNLANNPLGRLPLALCHLKAMDTLVLDGTSDTLIFPPPSAVDLGSSTAIMKFLAHAAGVEWTAPSAHVLASLEAGGRSDPRASAIDAARRAEEEHLAKLMAVRDNSTLGQKEKPRVTDT